MDSVPSWVRLFQYVALSATTGLSDVAGSVRKQTPAAAEAYFFRGEKGSHIIETELGTIGVGICYENQLAFTPGLMCGQSVDIMLMPHSAPAPTPVWWLPGKRREAIAEILSPEWPAVVIRRA